MFAERILMPAADFLVFQFKGRDRGSRGDNTAWSGRGESTDNLNSDFVEDRSYNKAMRCNNFFKYFS